MWESLIKYYDNLVEANKPVCPIAHTYITAHIGILIDMDGNFLIAMPDKIKGELVTVPCTIESDARSSNPSPHLISDKLCYVTNYPGYEKRHRNYLDQLGSYVSARPDDKYAQAVYNYTKKETILEDIGSILEESDIPKPNVNIVFAVYGLDSEFERGDLIWTEYYLSKLPKNGVCLVTGEKDHIPDVYPAGILSTSGQERLFLSGSPVGYIASQKIIHALQYMIYGKENADWVEACDKLDRLIAGTLDESTFWEWVEKKYPDKKKEFEEIVEQQKTEKDTLYIKMKNVSKKKGK